MEIIGISWAGTRTEHFRKMARFCEEVMGLSPRPPEPGIEAFNLPNGDIFEIVNPAVADLDDWICPKIDFLVKDVQAARNEMEKKGVVFIGPIYTNPDDGLVWSNFRAPDGHFYGLTSIPGHTG